LQILGVCVDRNEYLPNRVVGPGSARFSDKSQDAREIAGDFGVVVGIPKDYAWGFGETRGWADDPK
jgi:hypothetical protein